jgi:ribose 5-phosphate isomerase A
LLITVDPSKLVTILGSVFPVPVEIVPFGWETTAGRLRDKGFAPELRLAEDGHPYVTDGKHYILNCDLVASGLKPERAAEVIKQTAGVVEHGLFLGMTRQVIVGSAEGVKELRV